MEVKELLIVLARVYILTLHDTYANL